MKPDTSNRYNSHVHQPHRYQLKVLQQPSKARLCSFREKVDRRPIDPPPIVQLNCSCHPHPHQQQCHHDFLHNPYFFLYANLTSVTDDTDLYIHHGHRTTAGSVVQSLHKLKGIDNNDGGFFVFSDISVRLEGTHKLKFTLFEIVGEHVQRLVSVISDPFTVYSPKYFPGMSESSLLTRSFSDQGVRIRIRKDTRNMAKRQKTQQDQINKSNDILESEQSPTSPLVLPPLSASSATSSRTSSSASITPAPAPAITPIPSRSAMSMQHILSSPTYDSHDFYSTRTLPLPTRLLSHPLPSVLPPQFPHSSTSSTSSSSSSS